MVRGHELDAWVQKTDELGGIGSPDAVRFWSDFSYEPEVEVDRSLDPDGPDYRAQMLALYGELSGRSLDQELNEMSELEVEPLVGATSPYDGWQPADRALHYHRLGKLVRHAGLPRGARILDMGCGWGLTSEFLAQMGYEVVAVDINPKFVELVRRRTSRLDYPVTALQGTFDEFEAEAASFDGVLFYESLHHAVDLAAVVRRMVGFLKPGAPVLLAGEPIQSTWWPAWGLRLDAESVYCIRKFGWFESGWSQDYLARVLADSDLTPEFIHDADPAVGTTVVASHRWERDAQALAGSIEPDNWWLEGEHLVSNRAGNFSRLALWKPRSAKTLTFEVTNNSPAPKPLRVRLNGELSVFRLERGRNEITLDCGDLSGLLQIRFRTPGWSPAELLGTDDTRVLGFHLARAVFS